MTEKLDIILERYNNLNEQLSNPETLSNMTEWTKLSKERAELEETAEKYLEYKKVLKDQEDAKEALQIETDKDTVYRYLPCPRKRKLFYPSHPVVH